VKKYAKVYYLFIKSYAVDNGKDHEANIRLSIDRAQAVKEYLTTVQGVPDTNIYIIGYGDGEYAEPSIKEGMAKAGRRVEVELLAK
jgi:outer membrane protein OmpA-like peptidoglycan-associated protein